MLAAQITNVDGGFCMNIGILTFHRANNYGAVLQNYALQNTLIINGFRAVTIDYRSNDIEKWYHIKIIEKNGNIFFRIIRTILNFYKYGQLKKRQTAFDIFRRDILLISKSVNRENIKQLENDFDIFICGSDQIWNESIVASEDRAVYSLGFVKHSYKASYAASAGETNNISDDLIYQISHLNYVTVREKTLSAFLKKRGILSTIVCDPVFLMTKSDWATKIKDLLPQNTKKPYLFLYYVDSRRKESCKIARYIAHNRRLKIIYPTVKCKDTIAIGRCVYGDGPLEFISDIANAHFVVASSFHAVAFSIIFHKEFVAILHATTGERVKDLLEKVGLQERIISNLDDLKNRENSFDIIDYEKVDLILSDWRKDSLSELYRICDQMTKR